MIAKAPKDEMPEEERQALGAWIDEVWAAAQRPEGREAALRAEIARDLGDRLDLGKRLRLSILRYQTNCHKGGFCERFNPSKDKQVSPAYLYKHFQCGLPLDQLSAWPVLRYCDARRAPTRSGKTLALALGDDTVRPLARDPRRPDAFFEAPCEGPPEDMVAWFKTWLKGEPAKAPPNTGGEIIERDVLPNDRYRLFGDNRASLLADVIAHVRASEGPPIFCVHASETPDGLTAFAGRLWAEAHADDRTWVYLPVARGRPGAGDCRLAGVVGRLRAALDNKHVRTARPRQTDAETQDDIEALRLRLSSEQPCVLILDGAYLGRGVDGEIANLIRDEPTVALLWRLLRPVRFGEETLIDPAIFARTRVVVLADAPMSPVLPILCAKDARLPAPNADPPPNSEFVTRFVPAPLRPAMRALEGFSGAKETTVWLMRTLADIGKRHGQAPEAWIAQALDGKAHTHEVLIKAIVNALRRFDFEIWLALSAVVLTTSVTHRSSLARILRRWEILRGQAVDPPGLAKALVDLPRLFEHLITPCRGEDIPYLYDASLEGAYDPALWGESPGGADRLDALDMPDPVVRAAFRAALTGVDAWASDLADLHFAVAELCLTQHAIIVRRAPEREALSIRFYLRLIQAIHQGLLSLQYETAGQPAGPTPTLLPRTPASRLRALYELYRNELEEPPAWQLSRRFGVEGVKTELLQLMRQALTKHGDAESLGLEDQLREHLARAALRQNNFTLLQTLLPTNTAQAPSPYTKLRADWLTLDGQQDLAEETCRRRLEALLGFSMSLPGIGTEFDDLEEQAAQMITNKLAPALATRSRRETLGEVIDLIERRACVVAYRADAALFPGNAPEFGQAYILFRIAQDLPAALGDAEMIPAISLTASTTRVFVRVAMKLARKAEQSGRSDDADRFFVHGRAIADRLSRRVFSYPPDHVHTYIIEAFLARRRAQNPRMALRWLSDAEIFLPDPRSRPRTWVRFLFERVKTLRALARSEDSDLTGRQVAYAAALHEVDRLITLTNYLQNGLLHELALEQKEKLSALMEPRSQGAAQNEIR